MPERDRNLDAPQAERPRSGDAELPRSGEGDPDAGDPQKSYVTILAQQIADGLYELERPGRGLFLSGLSAGLDLGFSVLAIGVLGTLTADSSELTDAVVRANAYALGFVLVIFGRSELFTEHTTLAALPVLDGKASAAQLGRLWGLVFAGNLCGVFFVSAVVTTVGPGTGAIDPRVLSGVARDLLGVGPGVMLLSSLLAGWLMGLLSWLVTAGRDTTSQILFVWLVTATIGLAGLHHCVLGTAEILSAIFVGADVGAADFFRFLGLATLGNVVGGSVFVGVVKYAHASVVRGGLRDPSRWPGA